MAKRERQQVVIDQGPPERRQHNKIVVEQGADNRARLRILDQTEIDRLLLQRLISLDQHTAGEHLYRDIIASGYFPACKWAMDSNIRGDTQSLSDNRSNAVLKIGLARTWLLARAGRRITEYLFGVILGERRVTPPQVPVLRLGLDKFQSFEGWWHGRDIDKSVPSLLLEMPIPHRRHAY